MLAIVATADHSGGWVLSTKFCIGVHDTSEEDVKRSQCLWQGLPVYEYVLDESVMTGPSDDVADHIPPKSSVPGLVPVTPKSLISYGLSHCSIARRKALIGLAKEKKSLLYCPNAIDQPLQGLCTIEPDVAIMDNLS